MQFRKINILTLLSILAQKNNIILNCYNAGSVTGGNDVGGICGDGKLKIINCYNVEKVKSIGNYVGGIAGKIDCEKANNCYNSAKISGNSYIGSIFSSVSSTSTSNIQNCVYLTGTATYGIYSSGYRDLAQSSDTLPSVLSVINGDNAFVEDTNNINGGYPILSFQQ